jgi:hypothetical protein
VGRGTRPRPVTGKPVACGGHGLLLLHCSSLTGHFPFVAGGDLVDPRLLPGLLRPLPSRKKKRE